jgi:ABC-type phosphate transport system permease subunit
MPGAIAPRKRTRHFVERVVMAGLLACSVVAILTTVGIVLSLIFESIRFFQQVPILAFLFGTHWSPQSAFVGAGGEATANAAVFGAIPLFTGTLLITAIAMLVAAPIGLMSAIYLSDYASRSFRNVAKPVLEVLAGIPTVVYGFFAALTVAPFFRRLGESAGLERVVGIGAGRRPGHGDHDHPLRVVIVRRRDQRRAANAARRRAGDGRHPVGNDPQRSAAGGAARDRRCNASRRQPSHR